MSSFRGDKFHRGAKYNGPVGVSSNYTNIQNGNSDSVPTSNLNITGIIDLAYAQKTRKGYNNITRRGVKSCDPCNIPRGGDRNHTASCLTVIIAGSHYIDIVSRADLTICDNLTRQIASG